MRKIADYSDKKVIITGGASGIGKEIAVQFAQSGAVVILFDIDAKSLEKSADELSNKYNCKVYSMEVDVSDYTQFEKSVTDVVSNLGTIDVFINNAGIGVNGDFITNTFEEIDNITSVNYLGTVYGSRIILEHFYNQGYGHLVNVASVAGLYGFPRMSLYCGVKFGIIGFSQAIRFELKRKGIHVSVALPSSTDTPMLMNKLDADDDSIPGMLLTIPLCSAKKIAGAIYKGINKKKFMIFPTMLDRGVLLLRNFSPGIFNFFISILGFKSFKRKRKRLISKYEMSR